MRRSVMILLFTCACTFVQAQVNIITTICGDTAGNSGDNGPAIKAKLNKPDCIFLDRWDNIYIVDGFNHCIRKIDAVTKVISTVAGINGNPGFSGDGGQATDAQLFVPEDIAIDTFGNIYIADGSNRIRKVNASTGVITTIAGSGSTTSISEVASGDGGPATDAVLSVPVGVCLDKQSNIYVTAYSNNQIRRVDAVTGIITTIAGKGISGYTGGFLAYSGDGGPAIDATFSGPAGVAVDNTGNIFICDQWNHAVRKITVATGIIITIAGKGTPGYIGDNGLATNAQLNQPCGLYVDEKENVFIAEYGDGVVRKIDGATSIISTIAGTGVLGFSGDGVLATSAKLKCASVFLDPYGHIFIADMDNNRIREVYDSLTVSTPFVTLPEVKIYPNPAHSELTVEHAKGSEVGIYNLLGQPVLSTPCLSDKEVLSISALAQGMYIVHLFNPVTGFTKTVRVVVE